MRGFPKTCWLCLALLLTACGGGGGGGGAGNSSQTAVIQDAPPFPAPVERPDAIPEGDLSISGTITVSPALAVDMDTRDPVSATSTLPSNNLPFDDSNGELPEGGTPTFEDYSAQLIPSPGIVGGYLAVEKYRNGVPYRGDLHDFYRAYLAAGQVVSLQIADYKNSNPFANDFDLLLLDLEGRLIDFAAGLGPIETLRAPDEAGEYLLVVTICADRLFKNPPNICGDGRSNYTVTVGQAQDGFSYGGLTLSDEFQVNEALVVYHDDPLAEADQPYTALASSLTVEDSRLGDVHRVALPPPDIQLVQSSALNSAELAAQDGDAQQNETDAEQDGFFIKVSPEQEEKIATLAAIKSMHREENVAWAEPNFLREALFVPNDPGFEFQWHYPLINLPAAWDETTGANVTVAVLDTGILPFHPDIQNQLDLVTGGYDFVSSTFYSLDGDSVDADPTDPGDGLALGFRSSFHGTHVAGTIAAATNNDEGVAGVAYDARILPIRVLGRGVGTSFDIARGLCFAAGLTTGLCDGVPDNPNPADVINLSLGGTGSSLTEQQLFDEINAAGILVVAAAGNSSSSRPFYPAAYDGVFSVSALNISSELASYSNFGDSIDLAAPGGEFSGDLNNDGYVDGVLSLGADDSLGSLNYIYPFYQGTSMAAPHVAGVFALMRSVNEELDTPAMEQLLRAGDLTVALDDQVLGEKDGEYGYGMIDAAKSVTTALSLGGAAPTPVPWLVAVPNALNFGATLNTVEFDLRNVSGGPLDVTEIISDQEWLIAPAENGLGLYDLEVDRDGLLEGIYQGALTVVSDANTVSIDVIMQVNDNLLYGDVGHIYVRLIDTATGNIREVEADVVNGEYQWAIDDLPAGNYQLVAFTDADYDGRVCDVGEACGAYPSASQPEIIDLQTDLNSVDYSISYLNVGVELGSVAQGGR